jgi:hypothetical protein
VGKHEGKRQLKRPSDEWENEIGFACSAWGEKETRFWWENMRERDNLKDRGINGRMRWALLVAHGRRRRQNFGEET